MDFVIVVREIGISFQLSQYQGGRKTCAILDEIEKKKQFFLHVSGKQGQWFKLIDNHFPPKLKGQTFDKGRQKWWGKYPILIRFLLRKREREHYGGDANEPM